jgi:hypothetical protein
MTEFELTIKEVRAYKVKLKAKDRYEAEDNFWNNYSDYVVNLYGEQEISDEIIKIKEM